MEEGYAAHGTFPVTKIKALRSDGGFTVRRGDVKINAPDECLATERTKCGAGSEHLLSGGVPQVLRYDGSSVGGSGRVQRVWTAEQKQQRRNEPSKIHQSKGLIMALLAFRTSTADLDIILALH